MYRDDHQPTAYNRICSESIDESIKIFIKIIVVEMLSFVIAAIGPLHKYINYGTKSTFFCVRLPFLNENPDLEFTINISWELTATFLSFFGFVLISVLFVINIRFIEIVRVATQRTFRRFGK